MKRPPYREFVQRIDTDRFIDTLGILGAHTLKENKLGHPLLVGQCPDYWHLHKNGDQTGKFALNTELRTYNCFVCGRGSIIDLVMAAHDFDADSALDWLYELADAPKTDTEWVSAMDKLLSHVTDGRNPEVLPYYNPRVLAKYDAHEDRLRRWNAGEFDGKPKNIAIEVLHACGVRFAPDHMKYAPRDGKGIPIDDAYEGPCVIFPHFVDERLVGWQHRWLALDRPKWVRKYTNTPDFPRYTTVFRPFRGESHLPVVVVESVPTAMWIVGHGWPAVATFGATATDEQLKLLRRFQQGVVIAPDNDKPGVEALIKMANYLEGFIPVSYVEPSGDSGDDLMDRGGDLRLILHDAQRLS